MDDGRTIVLHPVGDIDLASAPDLDGPVSDALGRPGDRLVIDLSEVGFIDSTGVSALVKARNRAAEVGKVVVLRNPRPLVGNALRLLGLLEMFGLPDPRRPAD